MLFHRQYLPYQTYIQPLTTGVDWPEIGCLMEVSTMFYTVFVDTAFYLVGQKFWCKIYNFTTNFCSVSSYNNTGCFKTMLAGWWLYKYVYTQFNISRSTDRIHDQGYKQLDRTITVVKTIQTVLRYVMDSLYFVLIVPVTVVLVIVILLIRWLLFLSKRLMLYCVFFVKQIYFQTS